MRRRIGRRHITIHNVTIPLAITRRRTVACAVAVGIFADGLAAVDPGTGSAAGDRDAGIART
jgi:hypothetical protein